VSGFQPGTRAEQALAPPVAGFRPSLAIGATPKPWLLGNSPVRRHAACVRIGARVKVRRRREEMVRIRPVLQRMHDCQESPGAKPSRLPPIRVRVRVGVRIWSRRVGYLSRISTEKLCACSMG